jgi:hypothetical protein
MPTTSSGIDRDHRIDQFAAEGGAGSLRLVGS